MKTIFSGIQPSGTIHIGNYLGAIKQWVELQKNNTAYYCIVDLHAVTVPYDPAQLQERILDTAALYIAAGVDPDNSTLFVQSHVPAHTELAWLLATITPFGDLSRMTQFKDKSKKHKDTVSLGLFSYPALMAADILLYGADIVPVGEDQTQHIELTRHIAKRFNRTFDEVFTIPKAHTPSNVARVMSLTDSKAKMSKSDTEKSYIALLDSPDTIRQKISSAVTGTDPVLSFKKSSAAVKNLLVMYQAFTEQDESTIEDRFAGADYKTFKAELADVIVASLEPIQKKYKDIRRDDTELRLLLGRGAHIAQHTANITLHNAKRAMGLV